MFNYQKEDRMEGYAKLTYGDNCPIYNKGAYVSLCTQEAPYNPDKGNRRCTFFSHIVVAGICCKHPDAKG